MRRVVLLAAAAMTALAFAPPAWAQRPRPEISAAAEVLSFTGDARSLSFLGGRFSGALLWNGWLGQKPLIVEPRAGLRIIPSDFGTTLELVGDAVERLASASTGRGLRWQLTAEQRVRVLSNPPPPPAYFEPTRFETWLGGVVAVPLVGRLWMEGQGNVGLVRYGPEEWRVLDRNGAVGALNLTHPVAKGLARLSFATGIMSFANPFALDREDVRSEIALGWVVGRRVVLQAQAGYAWNNSSIEAYDYRSYRGALAVSAPLGRTSLQLYGELARKSYDTPGAPDDRVAPSDKDTGSVVYLQVTRPVAGGYVLHLRGGWTRSETGFRAVFFERFSLSALVDVRSLRF